MLHRVSFQTEAKCSLQHVAEQLCVKHERESKYKNGSCCKMAKLLLM